MRFRTLRQLLELVEPERELWWSPDSGAVSAAEISTLAANFDTRQGVPLAGRIACVFAASESQLAPLLVLLDGVCRQITLLPSTMSPDRLATIVANSGADTIVTTGPLPFTPPNVEVIEIDFAIQQIAHSVGGVSDAEAGLIAKTADPLPTRWVLPTSGTTGEPKLVAHSLSSLTRAAKHDLAKGKHHRWGSFYNLTGFAGLQVFLQSWCGGSCLILKQPDTSLEQQVEDLALGGCTALSATPTMWRKILMTCNVEPLRLKQITLGGEIVDQKILDALRGRFPHANIIHIYASTEAGVGFSVRDDQAGFPDSLLTDPPPGIQVAVDDQNRLLLRSDRNDQEYLNTTAQLKRDDGFIDTGDLVEKEGARFLFRGRANGTINVGGNKVLPEEVENFLLGCDGVQLARVSSRPNPFTGALVQAEIVADPSHVSHSDELKKLTLHRCHSELAAYKVPAILRVVTSIETTPSGKIERS